MSQELALIAKNSDVATGNPVQDPNVLEMLLTDKRSENTRRAYQYDVRHFFSNTYGSEPTPAIVRQFLALKTPPMAALILRYKARLIAENYSESTVNRRLSAIMSLVKFARRVGATEADPSDQIDAEKVVAYRDTRGITADQARLLLRQPDKKTLKGKRDFVLLLLLLENALRRAEIVALKIADFDGDGRTVAIRGKGRGTQKEQITLSPNCIAAMRGYLEGRSDGADPDAPLFASVSPAYYGKPLTADGAYKIVGELATQAGLKMRLSPHRLRHTAITLALDAAGGDIRRVQRLSRHARMETLQIYDDNRNDLQGEVTVMLSKILDQE